MKLLTLFILVCATQVVTGLFFPMLDIMLTPFVFIFQKIVKPEISKFVRTCNIEPDDLEGYIKSGVDNKQVLPPFLHCVSERTRLIENGDFNRSLLKEALDMLLPNQKKRNHQAIQNCAVKEYASRESYNKHISCMKNYDITKVTLLEGFLKLVSNLFGK